MGVVAEKFEYLGIGSADFDSKTRFTKVIKFYKLWNHINIILKQNIDQRWSRSRKRVKSSSSILMLYIGNIWLSNFWEILVFLGIEPKNPNIRPDINKYVWLYIFSIDEQKCNERYVMNVIRVISIKFVYFKFYPYYFTYFVTFILPTFQPIYFKKISTFFSVSAEKFSIKYEYRKKHGF